jgi:hypothetical protein
MRRLKAKGLSLRAIAARMAESGVSISHVGVQRVLSENQAVRRTAHPDQPPTTYDVDRKPLPDDARQQWLIHQIRRLQANGLTPGAIVEELTAVGVLVSQVTVRDVLQEAPR